MEARIIPVLWLLRLTVFDMHTLSGTLSSAFLAVPSSFFISFCVGAAEISVFACVAEQACGGRWDIHHGSRVRRWEERRRVWWLVWLGVRVHRGKGTQGEGCGTRWE